MAEADVSGFSVACNDGLCEEGESHESCPSDCKSGGADSYCDGILDNICDSDCSPELDSDCVLTGVSQPKPSENRTIDIEEKNTDSKAIAGLKGFLAGIAVVSVIGILGIILEARKMRRNRGRNLTGRLTDYV